MTIPDQESLCTITWGPRQITLDELAMLTSLLANLHADVAIPYVTSELGPEVGSSTIPPSPLVASVRINSPLIAELLAGSQDEGLILALGMVCYLLKHPDRFGAFLPAIKAAWYEGRTKAWQARLELIREQQKQISYIKEKGRLEAEGRPLEEFDRLQIDRFGRVDRIEREIGDRRSPGDRDPRGRDR